jgi:hypothetical protein
VLVQQALPTPASRRRPFPLDAVREVVASGAPQADLTGWFASLGSRTALLRARGHDDMADVLDRFVGLLGERDPLPVGAWHGDWGPWNMAWQRGHPQVWDWERYGDGVPAGLDVVHYLASAAIVADDLPRARARLQGLVLPALAALGHDRRQADGVVDAYLLEIASRYLGDAAGDTTLHRVVGLAHRYLSVLAGRNAWGAVEEFTRAA